MGWVQRIGTLLSSDAARLAVRDDPVGLRRTGSAAQSALLEQMAVDRDAQLADASLRRAARKVLVSLQNHWEGLTCLSSGPRLRWTTIQRKARAGCAPRYLGQQSLLWLGQRVGRALGRLPDLRSS